MLTAIDFDHEPSRLAAEIDDVATERHLATKFQSGNASVSQAKP